MILLGYFLWDRHGCTLIIFSGTGTPVHWSFSLDRYDCTLVIFSGTDTTVHFWLFSLGQARLYIFGYFLWGRHDSLAVFPGTGMPGHWLFSLGQVHMYIAYFLWGRHDCILIGYILWYRHDYYNCTLVIYFLWDCTSIIFSGTGTTVHWLFSLEQVRMYIGWVFSLGQARLYIDRHACTLAIFWERCVCILVIFRGRGTTVY